MQRIYSPSDFFFFTLCYLFWTLAKTTILNQRLINLCSHNFSTNIKRLSTIRRAGYINCSTVVFISFDIFRAFITGLLYTLTMQLWLVFLNLTHESKLGWILHLSTKNVVVIFPEQNDGRIPTKYNLQCKKWKYYLPWTISYIFNSIPTNIKFFVQSVYNKNDMKKWGQTRDVFTLTQAETLAAQAM